MEAYFQNYVFGSATQATTKDDTVEERSGSPHRPERTRPERTMEEQLKVDRLTSVALPRLEKGAVQHEMIVAFLYQQQRQRFWISDDISTDEGAFMRETWSDFITAPAPLSQSLLAEALVDLNAEVNIVEAKCFA